MDRAVQHVREQWLVLRCQGGDASAFEELILYFHPRLLRHARYLTGSEDVAMDVVQETWMAVVRGIDRLGDPALFRPWAYRIATNKCADRLRAAGRERQAIRDRPAHSAPESLVLSDNEELIQMAMAMLAADQRSILSLRYLEDMSTRQIAQVLSIPEGTVKSRLHAARNQLKTRLERSIP
jgi:RNA polymerase sigma-70 factor (ECF subfamily)